MGWAYGLKGMYPEAMAEIRTAMEMNDLGKGYLGRWLAKSGKRDEALKLLNELKQESTRNYVQSYNLALIYIGLGDKEEAMNHLEKHMLSRAETAINTTALAPREFQDSGSVAMTLATGTKRGRYEIRSQIGVGGMGDVYRASDLTLERASIAGLVKPIRLLTGLKKPLKNEVARWSHSKAKLSPISWATLLLETIALKVW